jgi:hypothetical protein
MLPGQLPPLHLQPFKLLICPAKCFTCLPKLSDCWRKAATSCLKLLLAACVLSNMPCKAL